MTRAIRDAFPGLLRGEWVEASPATPSYNCIAWAAGEIRRNWWPDAMDTGYWPDGAQREVTLEAFVSAFEAIGYTVCDGDDLVPGFERVAVFVGTRGIPTHAARQLETGEWTSKLGKGMDIRHKLHALSGDKYGTVAAYLCRALPDPAAT